MKFKIALTNIMIKLTINRDKDHCYNKLSRNIGNNRFKKFFKIIQDIKHQK